MRNFVLPATIFSTVLAMFLAPLYAHHGTDFLVKAVEMNTAVVRFAEMAANRTQNPKIKEFAQMLVRDHNQALDEISELRDTRLADSLFDKNQIDSKIAKAAAAVQLTPEHQRASEKLSSLSGADFDREFIDLIVRDHRQAIRDFESQSHVHGNAGSSNQQKSTEAVQNRQKPSPPDQQRKYSTAELRRDIDTVDFANATLPTLREHLQQAEALHGELYRGL
jgi:predicted outer membrane protein